MMALPVILLRPGHPAPAGLAVPQVHTARRGGTRPGSPVRHRRPQDSQRWAARLPHPHL